MRRGVPRPGFVPDLMNPRRSLTMPALVTRTRCYRALMALVLCGSAACSTEINTPLAGDDIQAMAADYVVFGMVSFITTEGVRSGRVQADTAYIFEDTSSADLHQMQIVFYDEEGRESATVTGTSGEWSPESDRMVARGEVVLLIHADSSTIESPEIHYDAGLDKIWSDSTTVRTMADGSVVTGTAFESDIAFENIRIQNMRGGTRRIF